MKSPANSARTCIVGVTRRRHQLSGSTQHHCRRRSRRSPLRSIGSVKIPRRFPVRAVRAGRGARIRCYRRRHHECDDNAIERPIVVGNRSFRHRGPLRFTTVAAAAPDVAHAHHHLTADGHHDHLAFTEHAHIGLAATPAAPDMLGDVTAPRSRVALVAVGLLFATPWCGVSLPVTQF